MKKTLRRFLGIMLVLILTVSIIPTSALEPDEESAPEETIIEEEEQEPAQEPAAEEPAAENPGDGENGGGGEGQGSGEEPAASIPVMSLLGSPAPSSEDNVPEVCPHNTRSEGQDNGYIVVTCLDCGVELSRTPIVSNHTHTYGDAIITKNASCSQAGEKTYYCTGCDYFYTETIPATSHSYEFSYHLDPDCDEEGYDMYICSNCNAEDKRNVSPAIGHDYRDIIVNLPGGGTYTITKCNTCGHVLKGEATGGSGHTHTYTSEVTKQPTCTEPGIMTYTCNSPDCDGEGEVSYTEEIPAKGHSYIWRVDSELSCTTDGVRHQECTECHATGETETTPATGHTWNTNGLMTVVVPPDCYNEGVAVVKCIHNDAQKRIAIPKTDHEFYETGRVPSTCTVKGHIEYTCDNCGDEKQEELPLADHTYSNTIVQAPTCTATGYKADVCTACGDEKNRETIPATGHSYEIVQTTDATCTKASTEKKVCSVCHAVEFTHNNPATGHEFNDDDWTVTVAPTCTTTGTESRSCRNGCGETQTREVEKVPHSYEWVRTTEPTIFATGEDSYKCSVCGDISDTREVPKLSHTHNFGAETVVTAPTCQATGVGKHTCSICNEEVSYEIPKVDHSYGELETDVPSTCVTRGQASKKCIWCGIKDGDSVTSLPLAEHTYSSEYTIDLMPTCSAEGSKSKHCTVDGCDAKTDVQSIAKTEHRFVETGRTAATCTENGVITYGCTDCDATMTDTETLQPIGHNYQAVITRPTCTTGGYTTYTCSRCEDSYIGDEVAATGHTPGEPNMENVTRATCSREGSYDNVTYCKTCHAVLNTERITVDKTAHTPGSVVYENETAPTCTETGSRDEVIYCSVCDAEVSRENKEIPALGHDYNGELTAPTCTTGGYTTYTCSRCGNVNIDDRVPATGHTPKAAVSENATAPTCTTAGSHEDVVYCETCNAEISRTTVEDAALGHDYNNVVTAPTCTTGGYTTHTCSRCEDSYTDSEVPATGHTPKAAVSENVTAPTCTTAGSHEDVIYCETCNTEISRTPVTDAALGHDYNDVVTAPTCTTDGYTTHTCSRCERTLVDTVVPATGHTPKTAVSENVTAPTCEAAGSHEDVVYCKTCNAEISRTPVTDAALGHDYREIVTAPTCTVDGYTTHKCSRCEASFVDSVTPATGHTPKAAVKEHERAATCETAGSHENVVYCETCNAEISRTTVEDAALGHDYKETVVAPTCSKKGYTLHKCSRCEAEFKDAETEKTAHTPGQWKTTKEPTCSATGVSSQYCSVCNEVITTRELPIVADAHKFVANTTNEKNPTCTEKGKRIDKCEYCNATKEVELAALGHNYKDKVTKEPTEDSEGVRTYTCTRCNDSYTRSIPKLEKKEERKEESSSTTVTPPVVPTTTPVPVITTPVMDNPTPIINNNVGKKTTNAVTENRPDYSAKADDSVKEVVEKLTNSKNETVVIENTDTKVTSEMLQAASDNNNEIVLKQDNYVWYIEGNDIKSVQDVDLGVKLGTSNIKISELKSFVKNRKFIEMSLVYDGPFGFDATLEVNVGKGLNGQMATLFYYNNGKFEKQGKSKVVNNNAKFKFSHASEYIIMFGDDVEAEATQIAKNVVADNKQVKTVNENKVDPVILDTSVQDADSDKPFSPVIPIVFAVVMIGIIAAIVFIRKKSR